MRIWILNHYASPPDRPAGTRHYDFGRVLAGQGHEVTIFASSFSHYSRREERLGRRQWMRAECMDGVRFVWCALRPTRQRPTPRAEHAELHGGRDRRQRRFPRPDVVVGSSVHPPRSPPPGAIGGVRRVPFVFEVRDLWPQALIDMGALHGERRRRAAASERWSASSIAAPGSMISLLPRRGRVHHHSRDTRREDRLYPERDR